MGIHFQRNRFVGAVAQETCNVLGGEFFQSQLFVLDDVDEFTEQKPVRECLVGNHCVHNVSIVLLPRRNPSPRTLALMMLKNGPTSPVIGSIPGQPVGSSSNQVFAFSSP